MVILKILFWSALSVLFYCYVGYGIFLFVFNKLRRAASRADPDVETPLLPVTLIVAAYNEGPVLSQKIKNCFEIDYPLHLLRVIFITDGSTDNSPELIGGHHCITLLHQSAREGKSAALTRAMRFVQTPVVVFSDANSMLNPNSIKAIVRHYKDKRIGGVAGEKKILQDEHCSIVSRAEGIYWSYESFLKKQDSDFNTVVGAAGELLSIRTELFDPVAPDFILDDLMLSMQVCLKGFKIKYEPLAFATERSSATLAEEQKRKIRIAAGAYQSISYLSQYMNIFKFPLLTIQYFSRYLLKWIAGPFLMILILIANLEMVFSHQGPIFYYLLVAQAFFYLLVVLGRIFIAAGWRMGVWSIPFYLVFMNSCLVKGFVKYVRGQQTVLWEKSVREAIE